MIQSTSVESEVNKTGPSTEPWGRDGFLVLNAASKQSDRPKSARMEISFLSAAQLT